jgi:hypothetical protein
LKLPHSDLNLRAELPSFERSDWNLHYRGRLTLADVRTIFRSPLTPDGIGDFSGQARYASGEWTANGHYQGHDFLMTYKWFHARGMDTWGDYEMAKNRLVVEKLNIRALGGSITGRLQMDTDTLAFRTETQVRGMSLSTAFAAVQNQLSCGSAALGRAHRHRFGEHMDGKFPAFSFEGRVPLVAAGNARSGIDSGDGSHRIRHVGGQPRSVV